MWKKGCKKIQTTVIVKKNNGNLNKSNNYQPCPVWVRLLSQLYDLFFLIGLLFILGFIFVLSLNAIDLKNPLPNWVHSFYYLFWILFYYAYFWHKGQTPAMRVWRLKYTNPITNSPITNQQILIRLSMGIIAIPSLLYCFFNSEKKSLVDIICKSQLVRQK